MGTEDEEYIPDDQYTPGEVSPADLSSEDPGMGEEYFASSEDEEYVPSSVEEAEAKLPPDDSFMAKKWAGPVFILVGFVVVYFYLTYFKAGGQPDTQLAEPTGVSQPLTQVKLVGPEADAETATVPQVTEAPSTTTTITPIAMPEVAATSQAQATPEKAAVKTVTTAVTGQVSDQAQAAAPTSQASEPKVDTATAAPSDEGVTRDQAVASSPATAQPTTGVVPVVDEKTVKAVADLQEKHHGYMNRFDDLQSQMSGVRESVNQVKSLMRKIDKRQATLQKDMVKGRVTTRKMKKARMRPSAAARAPQRVAKPRVYYVLRALVPGRAWLQSGNGDAFTVKVGDLLYGLGKVTRIEADTGKVVTSSGWVINFGYEGISRGR